MSLTCGFLHKSAISFPSVLIFFPGFFPACLACIYLSDKPQFGFKSCLLRSWLKMKFSPGYVFPLVCISYCYIILNFEECFCFKVHFVKLIRVLLHVAHPVLNVLIIKSHSVSFVCFLSLNNNK